MFESSAWIILEEIRTFRGSSIKLYILQFQIVWSFFSKRIDAS